jgi:hypothetical protein
MRHILILACAVLIGSCENDDPTGPTDYRDGFAGTYSGWRKSTFWTMNQPMQTTYDGPDTYVVTMVDDSSLSINGGTAFPITDAGEYSQYAGGSNYYGVRFADPDSLLVTMSSGGLGGNATTNFKGRKEP